MEVASPFMKNSSRIVLTTESIDEFLPFKQSNQPNKVIGTHSGQFHGDEVLSTVLLKYLPTYASSVIIRTRNLEILSQCDLVCDVGGEYNITTLKFDHHMKEFKEQYNDELKIKLSSAGLIYKHFGKDIIENYLKGHGWYEENKIHIDKIVLQVYKAFIMMVDAIDNGINQYPGDDLQPRFNNSTTYASRISRLNPEWNNPDASQSDRFKQAQDVAEEEFYHCVKYLATSYFKAYDIVKAAVDKRKEIDPSGSILFIEPSCPWKDILFTLEAEMKIEGQILFAILPQNKRFNISTVPLTQGNFKFRKGLPVDWRGVNEAALKEKSGFSDIVFVHSSGFCGAADSYQTAIAMIRKALLEKQNN